MSESFSTTEVHRAGPFTLAVEYTITFDVMPFNDWNATAELYLGEDADGQMVGRRDLAINELPSNARVAFAARLDNMSKELSVAADTYRKEVDQ